MDRANSGAPAPGRSVLWRYLTTALLARLADEGMPVAVTLLALHRSGSAGVGAAVMAAWLAPHVLSAPLAGALAARTRRPGVFYAATLGGFAAAIGGVGLLAGRAPLPAVVVTAAAGGCCGPLVASGLSSVLAGLVPETERARAYALDAAVFNAASVTGPAAVTLLAAVAAPGAGMALLTGAAGCAALLVAALPVAAPPLRSPTQSLAAALRDGLRAVLRIPALRAITAATCLAFVGIGGLTVTAVLLAADRASGDADGAGGLLVTALALGALAGSLAVARWPPPITPLTLAGCCLVGTGVTLAAAAVAPWFWVSAALFAAAGLCDGPLLGATLRIRAEHAPEGVRPQVFTLGAGLKISAAACGAALTGALADRVAAGTLLLAIAVLQLAAAAVLWSCCRGRPTTGERRADAMRPT